MHGKNQRLPKSLRIRQSSEIRSILIQGQKHIGKHVTLYSLPSITPLQTIRAGFLSPKRIGKAVHRNLVRRRLRELFRKHQSEMNGSQQILIMGRTSAIHTSFQSLENDFLQLCQKARLLSPRDP